MSDEEAAMLAEQEFAVEHRHEVPIDAALDQAEFNLARGVETMTVRCDWLREVLLTVDTHRVSAEARRARPIPGEQTGGQER